MRDTLKTTKEGEKWISDLRDDIKKTHIRVAGISEISEDTPKHIKICSYE